MKLALCLFAAVLFVGSPLLADAPVASAPHRERLGSSSNRSTQNRASQNRATQNRATQNRATQNRGGSRATQNRATQNRAGSRATQNRPTHPTQSRSNNAIANHNAQPRSMRGRPGSSNTSQIKYDDAKMNPASDKYDENLAAKYNAQKSGAQSSGKKVPSKTAPSEVVGDPDNAPQGEE